MRPCSRVKARAAEEWVLREEGLPSIARRARVVDVVVDVAEVEGARWTEIVETRDSSMADFRTESVEFGVQGLDGWMDDIWT